MRSRGGRSAPNRRRSRALAVALATALAAAACTSTGNEPDLPDVDVDSQTEPSPTAPSPTASSPTPSSEGRVPSSLAGRLIVIDESGNLLNVAPDGSDPIVLAEVVQGESLVLQ